VRQTSSMDISKGILLIEQLIMLCEHKFLPCIRPLYKHLCHSNDVKGFIGLVEN